MSNALSARRSMPLLGAVLLALVVLSLAVAAPKALPASKPSKSKAATPAEVERLDDAAAFRLLRKTEPITKHPGKATQAQLLQAARDLALASELSPTFELAPWFHADLGVIFYARAKAKRGAERTYLLEKANVQFHLAACTHHILLNGDTDASEIRDFEAAGDATASFILYHVGLLEHELGRPSNALIPLGLLLAADHDLRRPEYVQKARTLLAEVRRADEKEKEKLLGH